MKPMYGMRGVCCMIIAGAVAAVAQSPITSIISPADGDSFYVGDTMHIQWTADESQLSRGIVVEISFKAGEGWYQISPGEAMPNTTRELRFPIPDTLRTYDFDLGRMVALPTVSDSVLLFVYEYDGEGIYSGALRILPSSAQGVTATARGGQVKSLRIAAGRVTIPTAGEHAIMLLDGQGRCLRNIAVTGPTAYAVPATHLTPGMYLVQVHSGDRAASVGRVVVR